IGGLAANPLAALAELNKHLAPLTADDAEPIRRLLRDLESRRFKLRDRAAQELAKTPAEWDYLLRDVLAGNPSLEVRRRLEPVLESPSFSQFSPALVRKLRAVQALEMIGSAEARKLISRLASGLPEARLTQDAKDALRRLQATPK